MKKIKEKGTKLFSFLLVVIMVLGMVLPFLPPLSVKANVDKTTLTVTKGSSQTATFTHAHRNNGSITTQKIQANTTITGATASGYCYTNKRQHAHEGSTKTAGACYTPVYHQHTTSCHKYTYHSHTDACREYKIKYDYRPATPGTAYFDGGASPEVKTIHCVCGYVGLGYHQSADGVHHSYLHYENGVNAGYVANANVQTMEWWDLQNNTWATTSTCGSCWNPNAVGTASNTNAPWTGTVINGSYYYWTGRYICGKTTSTVIKDEIVCGKTTSTIDSYKLKTTDPYYTSALYTNNCGITAGATIAKATVSASNNNVLTLSMSNVNAKASYTVTWTKPDGSTVNGGTTMTCDMMGTYKCTVNVKTTINNQTVDNDTATFSYTVSPNPTTVKFMDGYRLPETTPTSSFYSTTLTRGSVPAGTRMTAYPTYTGYTFLGIYTGTDTTSKRVYDENGQYLGDDSFLPINGGTINLYCLYAPKSITITYDTHNPNGLYDGDMGVAVSGRFHSCVDTPDVKTDVITYDTVNATLSNQAKTYEGYTFDGWYDSETGSGSYVWWMNGWMPYMGTGNKIFDANGLVAQKGKYKGTGSTLQHILKLSADTTLYPRYIPNAYTLYYYTDKANTQLSSKTVYYDAPVEVTYYDWRDYSVKHYQSVPSSYQNYYNFTATGGSVNRENNDVGFVPDGCEYVEGYYFDGWDWEDTGNPAVRPWFNNPTGGSYYDTSLNDSTLEANGNSKLWKWAYDRTLVTVYKPNHYGLRYCDRILNRDGNGDLVDPDAIVSINTNYDFTNNVPIDYEDFIETTYTDVVYDSTDNFAGTIREYEGYTLDGYYGVLYFPYGSPEDYGRTWIIDGQQYRINPCDYYGHGWNNQRHTYENRVIDVMTGDASNLPAHEVPDSYTPDTTEVPEKELLSRVDGTDTTPPVNLTKLTKWVGKVYNADGTLVDGKWDILFDTNIYPRYTPNHYTLSINFNKEDDVSLDQRDMIYNEKFGLADAEKVPTAYKGYTFNGWYDDTLGQIFDENGNNVSGNLWKYTQDVNAKATYTANDYIVYYNTNEADTPNIPLNVTFDQDYELPQSDVDKVPNKDGYTFIGWYDVDTGEKIFNIDGTPVNNPYNFDRDITVAVRYSNNPIDIRIATETDRKVNSGVGNRSEYEYDYSMRTEEYHTPYGIITVPTKRGYDFGGYKVEPTNNGEPKMIWNTDGKASEDIFKWLPTKGETVVYATSVFTPATIKGDIDAKKYDPKTDTETDNPIHIEQVYDEPYDKLPHIPEKEGYIYDGITDKDGNPIWDKDGNPVQDVWQYIDGDIDNFIIKWTPKWYILTYDNNTKEQKVYFGEDVPNLDTMSKAGFRFNGYSFDYFGRETNIVDGTGKYTAGKWLYDMGESGQRIPLKDLWEVETYTVTVNDGIGEPYTVSVVYGMGYTNVEVPRKTGYVFEGYYVDGEDNTEFWNDGGKPTFEKYEYTKDISVTAKYRAKVFYLHCGDTVIKVTYDDIVNGTAPIGTKDDETVGNHINHYLFGGWTYNGMLIFGGDGISTMDRWTLDLGEDGTHIYLDELFDLEEEKIKEDDITPDEPEETVTVTSVTPVPTEKPDHSTPNVRKIIETVIKVSLSILFVILVLLILFWLFFLFGEVSLVYRYNERKSERKGKPVQTLDGICFVGRYKKKDRVENTKHYINMEKVLFRKKDRYYHMLLDSNADMVSIKFGFIWRNLFYRNTDIIILCNDIYNKYHIGRKDKNKGDLEKHGKLQLHLTKKFGEEEGDYVYLPPKSTETRKYY